MSPSWAARLPLAWAFHESTLVSGVKGISTETQKREADAGTIQHISPQRKWQDGFGALVPKKALDLWLRLKRLLCREAKPGELRSKLLMYSL